jgi:hypothetical protein
MMKPIQKVPALLTRWRKAPQPFLLTIDEPLPSEPMRTADQVAARQEWDAEGGAITPPTLTGPKLPL